MRFDKVFNVGLHRTGTKSVHELLLRSDVRSVHWPVLCNGINYEDLVMGLENDRPFVAATLAPLIADVTAVSDVPIPALYDLLDAAYPNSGFIAIFRTPFDWVRSVRSHVQDRDLHPFERVQYWRYLSGHPTSLRGVDDTALYTMFLTHYRDVLSYFRGRDNLLFMDLQEPDLGEKVCGFLDLPPTDLRNIEISLRIM